ncbi:MAG: T9SS type A sorting domain-containing protein [Ferruginibacter sp.]
MKKIIFILTLIIGINFTSFAQNKIPAENVSSVQQKLIKFYPNPATSVINFDFQRANDKSYTLEVYSSLGKLMYDTKSVPSRFTLNLDSFYRGIYYFLLRDKNGVIVESGKFQVVK